MVEVVSGEGNRLGTREMFEAFNFAVNENVTWWVKVRESLEGRVSLVRLNRAG
jgi:hypothetical protein